MKLNDIAYFVEDKISSENIKLDQYVTTDSLLQNKKGRTFAQNLPPQKCSLVHFKKGDVLLGNIRPYLKKIWYANIEGGCSQDVLVLRAKNNLESKFLYALLMQDSFFDYEMKATKGSKMPRGDKSHIINFPCLDLNNKTEIGKLLSSLDDKIALNNRIKAKLEQMAKRLYDYWFVQFDFPWSVSGEPCLHEFSRTDDGNARSDFPNADAKPYKSTGGKMVWNEELKREIPAGWEVKKMGEIALVKRGTTITEKDTTKGNVKVVAGGLDFSYYHNQSNRKANCITVSGSGENAGFVNFWREPIFASDCSTAQCENDIDTMLCYFALKMQEKRFYRISHKSAQPHIYPKDVAEIPIVVPNEAVKSKISDFFLKSNWKIALIEKETQKLTALRDRLLPLLMNGQVEVN
nr:restriction endonuclease subunit S [uncultured Treponema sp.]